MKWLVQLYPRAWRERYQDEFEAMLEQHKLTVFDRLNIALGVAFAWLNPRFHRLHAPTRSGTAAVVSVLSLVIAMGVMHMESTVVIVLAILVAKVALVVGTLALALMVYRRASRGSHVRAGPSGAAWRRGAVSIAAISMLFCIAEEAWLLTNHITLYVVLLGPLAHAVVFFLVLIGIYSLVITVVPRPSEAPQ